MDWHVLPFGKRKRKASGGFFLRKKEAKKDVGFACSAKPPPYGLKALLSGFARSGLNAFVA